jgi:hypothetical protein
MFITLYHAASTDIDREPKIPYLTCMLPQADLVLFE